MSRSRRTAVFAAICGFSFLVNFGRVAFAPLVEPFMATFGVREATAGLVATAVWLGSALPRLPTGYLLTRIRRHEAIIGQGVLLVLAAAFTAIAPTIGLVTLGALFVGIATGVFYIAANPLVSELYPEKVGWAVGLRGTSSQIAAVAAPILVGVALGLGSWRVTFAGLATAALVVGVGFVWTTRRADLPAAGQADRDLLLAARRQWDIILTGIAIIGTVGFVWQGMFNFYVSYLIAEHAVSEGLARQLLTLVFAAGVPAFTIAGRLADRVSSLPLLFAFIGTFVVTMAGLIVAPGVLGLVVVSVFMGFSIHAVFPIVDTYMLASLPDEHRGSAYAVYSATMLLIQAPGSVVLGTIVEGGVAYNTVFVAYAASILVGLAVMLILYLDGRLPSGPRPTGD